MQVFLGIAYFIVGIVQLFAIMDGVGYVLNVGSIVSFLIGIVLTYIPILGSGLGVYGAVTVWDWSIWQAAALFFWYIPVIAVLGLFGAFSNR